MKKHSDNQLYVVFFIYVIAMLILLAIFVVSSKSTLEASCTIGEWKSVENITMQPVEFAGRTVVLLPEHSTCSFKTTVPTYIFAGMLQ